MVIGCSWSASVNCETQCCTWRVLLDRGAAAEPSRTRWPVGLGLILHLTLTALLGKSSAGCGPPCPAGAAAPAPGGAAVALLLFSFGRLEPLEGFAPIWLLQTRTVVFSGWSRPACSRSLEATARFHARDGAVPQAGSAGTQSRAHPVHGQVRHPHRLCPLPGPTPAPALGDPRPVLPS